MSLSKERIHYLLEAYIFKHASSSEENELMEWILEAEEDSGLKSFILEIWNQHKSAGDLSYVNWDEIYSCIMRPPVVSIEPKVRRLRWARFAAAAVILVALATGTYLYFTPRSQYSVAMVQPKQNDIAPPSVSKAVLTLADGTKMELDSGAKGAIAVQGSVRIIKKSSEEISYVGASSEEVNYNTLSVPRGSKPMMLLLSDGSKVWLNVSSSITYPTAFIGKEREVEITGEAYFEIAHDATKPFIVRKGETSIEVLGTRFNVCAYDDAPSMKVTLLQGSVKVKNQKSQLIMTPGEQVVGTSEGHFRINKNADLDEVKAWREGKFDFNNADLATVMRQISRWYDVEVVYRGKTDFHFGGQLSRNSSLVEIFKILELSGVKFTIDGRKVTVLP